MTTFDPQPYAAALGAAEAAIDWAALEPVYCEGDAEGFFSEERLDAIRDAGLHFAGDLGELLAAKGRSLYVGAGVAELAPLLFGCIPLGELVKAIAGPDGFGEMPSFVTEAMQQGEALFSNLGQLDQVDEVLSGVVRNAAKAAVEQAVKASAPHSDNATVAALRWLG